MIRSVRLRNWRAYKQLDLDLTKPVTFLVAPNGVGKTSFIEAVKWAIFGVAPSVEKGRAVRIGEKDATVELTISLPSGSTAKVKRTLMSSGKSTFECSVDGADKSESDYLRLLTESWGAAPDVLLALMFGEASPQASSAFPIRDHLAEVFGITPLVNGISTIDARLKTLAREIKAIKSESGVDPAAIRDAEERSQVVQSGAELAAQSVMTAKTTVEGHREQARAAEAWSKYRSDLDTYEQQTATLVEQLQDLLDIADRDADALATGAEEKALRELEESRAAAAEAQIRAASAGSAASLLGTTIDVCPTCLRPLSEHERVGALTQHEAARTDAGESIETQQRAVDEAAGRLAQVKKITRSLREMHVPRHPDQPDAGADAIERFRAAEEELLTLTELQGAEVARMKDAQASLLSLRTAAEENTTLVNAYREEILLQVARDSLKRLVDRYMTERIQPLTEQVSTRWKLLFGSEGLQLSHEGSISYRMGGEELKLTDLSGGERVVALFVTRLLVVASATRATTLWLDEPLEHLDPHRRAVVARTIAKAAQQGALGQIVVTTYEERLARQLAASASEIVGVEHLRSTPT